jgi:hypothetical protein
MIGGGAEVCWDGPGRDWSVERREVEVMMGREVECRDGICFDTEAVERYFSQISKSRWRIYQVVSYRGDRPSNAWDTM